MMQATRLRQADVLCFRGRILRSRVLDGLASGVQNLGTQIRSVAPLHRVKTNAHRAKEGLVGQRREHSLGQIRLHVEQSAFGVVKRQQQPIIGQWNNRYYSWIHSPCLLETQRKGSILKGNSPLDANSQSASRSSWCNSAQASTRRICLGGKLTGSGLAPSNIHDHRMPLVIGMKVGRVVFRLIAVHADHDSVKHRDCRHTPPVIRPP